MREFKRSDRDELCSSIEEQFNTPVTLRYLGGYLGRNELFRCPEIDAVVKVFHAKGISKSKREIQFYNAIEETSIPAPRLLGFGAVAPDEPWLATSFECGTPLEDTLASGSGNESPDLWRDFGRITATIHSTVDGAQLPDGMVRDYHKTFQRLDNPSALAKQAAEVLELATSAVPASLVHGDLSTRNLLVAAKSGGTRITAILDFERAALDDAAIDFAMFWFKDGEARPDRLAHFLDGYRATRDTGPGFRERVRHHLIGLLIEIETWAVEDDPAYYGRAARTLQRVLADDLPEIFD